MDLPEMDQEELDDIAARAKRYYETTDKALCGVFNGNVFELGQLYWGYENFYCNMMDEDTRDMMDRYFEKRVDLLMKDLEKYLAACGKYIECIEFTEDLGTQTSLLIPPGMYREADQARTISGCSTSSTKTTRRSRCCSTPAAPFTN